MLVMKLMESREWSLEISKKELLKAFPKDKNK
jgi:hypothetical protein